MGDANAGIFIKSTQFNELSAGHSNKIQTGDRLLSINDRNIEGMTVQKVADVVSLASNPCRLKLSRQGVTTTNRKDPPTRPTSVDGDLFFQRTSKNSLMVKTQVKDFSNETENSSFSSD